MQAIIGVTNKLLFMPGGQAKSVDNDEAISNNIAHSSLGR